MIRHVSIDLTQVPLDAADYDRDMPNWDIGLKPPSYRKVKDLMRVQEGIIVAEDKDKIEERIDALYKNLEHISNSYFSSEGIFPFWESVYALIVGQFLVAYFTSKEGMIKIILIIAGIVFSIIWFFVVSIGWHYSEYRANTMKYLEWKLMKEYKKLNSIEYKGNLIPTCEFYPQNPITDRYLCENIIDWKLKNFGSLFIKLRPTRKVLTSSWYYRRWIPIILFLIWLLLLIHSIYVIFEVDQPISAVFADVIKAETSSGPMSLGIVIRCNLCRELVNDFRFG